jgi:hypothetical protein
VIGVVEDSDDEGTSIWGSSKHIDERPNEGMKAGGSADNVVGDKRDRAAEERARRARQKLFRQFAAEMGLPVTEAVSLMEKVEQLRPDLGRMSPAEDVTERLAQALDEFPKSRPQLLYNRSTKAPIDITRERPKVDLDDKVLKRLPESEEELFKALIINRRMATAYANRAEEHGSVEGLILAELVRRRTDHEQWRHMVPQYYSTVVSMLVAAGAGADDFRERAALIGRLAEAIAAWWAEKNKQAIEDGLIDPQEQITAEKLKAAAKRSEDELLSELEENFARHHPVEPFAKARKRLAERLRHASPDVQSNVSLEHSDVSAQELGAMPDHTRQLATIYALGGGIAETGQVVFASVEAFARDLTAHLLDAFVSATPEPVLPWQNEDPVALASTNSDEEKLRVPGDVTTATVTETDAADIDVATISDRDERADYNENDVLGDVLTTEPEGLPAANIEVRELADTDRDAVNPRDLEPTITRAADAPDNVVFDPAWISPWPRTEAEVMRLTASLPRSAGISRSTGSDPFGSWNRTVDNGPFCFMGFRRHFRPASPDSKEGPIEPRELSRMELGEGRWRISVVPGPSPVLGRSMPLMVPQQSALSWYGRTLASMVSDGMLSSDTKDYVTFGSPLQPETITPEGDPKKLARALSGMIELFLNRMIGADTTHYLADQVHRKERSALAVQHLTRWWIFVLLARHRQADFDRLFPDDYFLGAEGPDFYLDENGTLQFGTDEVNSHCVIHLDEGLEAAIAEGKERGGSSSIYSGPAPR